MDNDCVTAEHDARPRPAAHEVCAIVPAHNEAAGIADTLAGLREQTSPVTRVVVVADNCTDDTAEIARRHGAEVVVTEGNQDRKAGALNQAIARLDLPALTLVMDADTVISPRFVELALEELRDPAIGAVGAVFTGEGRSFLERCQVNEWARYARQLSRANRVWVLSGTAALIRSEALRAVAQARGTTLPGRRGDVYLSDALTEDFELTLALRTVGYDLRSPLECSSTTEVMPTWPALWRQRSRWYAGALQTVGTYGMTRVTWRYWGQQVMLGLSTFAMALLLIVTATAFFADDLTTSPFWIAVGVAFWVNQVVTSWRHRQGRWLSVLLLPELVYALFLQAVFADSIRRRLLRQRLEWGHLESPAGA